VIEQDDFMFGLKFCIVVSLFTVFPSSNTFISGQCFSTGMHGSQRGVQNFLDY
jgi:hypothetical protein